ncbi:MAG: LPS export ABC transporter periplasmic protein LptC [Candidatus Omnitrophota bacterium]
MMFRGLIIFFVLFFLVNFTSLAIEQAPEQSDQQIDDFSLAGYGEQGKKTWELFGKSADIFGEVIKLKDITGNLYGKEENIKLTSDKGDFNKAEGKVHLEENVVITTTSGAKLTTNSLDWDRKNQQVNTKDVVNIERENMLAIATGASGAPNLNKVNLEKDVTVEIFPAEKEKTKDEAIKEKIVITCDGPLQIDYEKNVAVFNNNVKVDREASQIYCDKMDIYFLKNSDKKQDTVKIPDEANQSSSFMSNTSIDKLICRGNVKIVRGENISYSDEAVYSAIDKKITLTGRPKLILYSSEDLKNASFGN